jgi:hypothetical protein
MNRIKGIVTCQLAIRLLRISPAEECMCVTGKLLSAPTSAAPVHATPLPLTCIPLLQGGPRGVPSAPDSLPISIGTATSGRTTSAGDTSSSSEVGCLHHMHVVTAPNGASYVVSEAGAKACCRAHQIVQLCRLVHVPVSGYACGLPRTCKDNEPL